MPEPIDPAAVLEAMRAEARLPPGVRLDLNGRMLRLRAYAGTNPATGKPHHLYEPAELTIRRRELEELALVLAGRAAELKATRRLRRKEGGHAELPAPIGAKSERVVRHALETWWKAQARNLPSSGTARQHIDVYLKPLHEVALWRLRSAVDADEAERDPDLYDLSDFFQGLLEGGAAGHPGRGGERVGAGRPLAPATVDRIHATLSSALSYVATKGWLPAGNPAATILLPTPNVEAVLPDKEVMDELVAWLAEEALEVAVCALLVANGPRPQEVAALRRGYLDEASGALALPGDGVARVATKPERWEVRATPTSKRRRRRITLEPTLMELLRRLELRRAERALKCGVELTSRSFILSDAPDGSTHVTPHSLGTAFRRALERARTAGIRVPLGMTLYDCRHYGITHAGRAGVARAELARRFGTSKRMIDERYDHELPPEDEAAAVAMATVFGPELLRPAAGAEVIPLRPRP